MTNAVRNFHEFMPEDVWKWKYIENKVDKMMSLYNYQEIRLSILQDYHVLHNGITALMQEEQASMVASKVLSLNGKDNDISLVSLRPGGTISVLHHTASVIKPDEMYRFYYHGPMFRKDNDQSPMEFYQLGVELLGSESVLSENEVICLGMKTCQELGLRDVRLELNSFGCEDCRRGFNAAMQTYLEDNRNALCEACFTKLFAEPMSDNSCQINSCKEYLEAAPKVNSFLCDKCRRNFSKVKRIQANLAHVYKENSSLVKNFSYYNETVFDFVINHNGEDIVIGGGGRYDYLSEKITGKKIPAVGFYLNLDTVFTVMESRNIFSQSSPPFSVYICAQSPDLEIMMLQIATELHENSITTIINPDIADTEKEKITALKKGCSLMIILRDNNIREGKVLLYNIVKEHPQYLQINQLMDEILIARKSLI